MAFQVKKAMRINVAKGGNNNMNAKAEQENNASGVEDTNPPKVVKKGKEKPCVDEDGIKNA